MTQNTGIFKEVLCPYQISIATSSEAPEQIMLEENLESYLGNPGAGVRGG